MDLQQHTAELFHGNIESTMQSLDTLTAVTSACGELIVHCLLNEKKVLCCGEGRSGALAQIFSSNLLNRFNYERPSLPAIALNSDATTLTAIAGDGSFTDIFAKQIRALGQAGDALLLISNDGNYGASLQAIQAAHDREMLVISISNQDCSDISALLLPEDIELLVPGNSRARVLETQLLIINSISELIDLQLFGGEA